MQYVMNIGQQGEVTYTLPTSVILDSKILCNHSILVSPLPFFSEVVCDGQLANMV